MESKQHHSINHGLEFVVNGSAIPEVDFDIGESYAGLMPISNATNAPELYFWFFPSTNPAASNEILIWLNGGPGCSSLEGFLQGEQQQPLSHGFLANRDPKRTAPSYGNTELSSQFKTSGPGQI